MTLGAARVASDAQAHRFAGLTASGGCLLLLLGAPLWVISGSVASGGELRALSRGLNWGVGNTAPRFEGLGS